MYWFKMSSFFSSESRVIMLENMKDGERAIAYYIKLYCMAAQHNQGGAVYLRENTPHNVKTLATQWNKRTDFVRRILGMLEKCGFIERVNGVIFISDWDQTQSADKLEEMRKNARLRKQKSRANRAKMLKEGHVTVTGRHTLDIEEDIEKEIEEDIEEDEDEEKIILNVTAQYTAATGKAINSLSKKQKAQILKSVDEFGIEQIIKCFNISANSDFLNGKNQKGWVANFDWLINNENIPKVLNGNYDIVYSVPQELQNLCSFDTDEFYNAALTRGFGDFFETKS